MSQWTVDNIKASVKLLAVIEDAVNEEFGNRLVDEFQQRVANVITLYNFSQQKRVFEELNSCSSEDESRLRNREAYG